MLNRREFLAGAAAMAAPAARKPNIVFILADDLGYGDVGCFGSKLIQTPNIDRLAAEGMKFNEAYAGAVVCAPSRSCLMTGQHTGHTRIRENHSGRTGKRVPLLPEDFTVAQMLKQAGYATGIFGKWGLGEPDTPGIPTKKGFDHWFGFLNQDHAVDYYTDYLWRNEAKEVLKGNLNGGRKEYAQDLFTREALNFIGEHRKQPFFLYLPYTTPHADLMVPSQEPYANRDWPEDFRIYAAMVTRMDRDIGRIMAALKQAGLDRDTLVFFTSDNGAGYKQGRKFFNSTGPFREAKGSVYEGGIHVPMVARWPGRIQPGAVSDLPWAFWDFMPTAAELAGVTPPANIDGISIAPTLFGQPQKGHEYLYWEANGKAQGFAQAIRMGNWKGVRFGLAGPLELYDLSTDPGEAKDVAARHPEIVARMTEALRTARTDSDEYPVEKAKRKAKAHS
ncbi:MAG: arylsulfatase [Bryobacteraceae bacterium]